MHEIKNWCEKNFDSFFWILMETFCHMESSKFDITTNSQSELIKLKMK